ncbi:hypothetical protein F2981_04155 [Sinorhizobium meliloti]|nr:hypothetical protein [Sinorhizobium meliloti]
MTADLPSAIRWKKNTGNYVKEERRHRRRAVRHPLATTDFSSFLLQGQSSGAKVNRSCQCRSRHLERHQAGAEFGIVQGGQRLAALLFTLAEVHGLGLDAAQGCRSPKASTGTATRRRQVRQALHGAQPGKMP